MLIGIRAIGTSLTEKSEEVGDILTLIDPRIYGKLKKQEGLNALLFTNLENEDSAAIKRKVRAQEEGGDVEDDFFQRAGEEDDDEEGDDEVAAAERKLNKKTQEQEINKKRDQKYLGGDDDGGEARPVNVDDL